MPTPQQPNRSAPTATLYKPNTNLTKVKINRSFLDMKKSAVEAGEVVASPVTDCDGGNRVWDQETIDNKYHAFINDRRYLKWTSSFLRPGSRFSGTQVSGRDIYEVDVELKFVDMDAAFLCGYLHIYGLTSSHPRLVTYFEGEMVSDKFSFFTDKEGWGASRKIDLDHWKRFEPWRTIGSKVQDPHYVHENYTQREHIYMRWKECFLVPDHTVKSTPGASWAGFYYICFDQVNGSISGLYYHESSYLYQQLNLTHTPDDGALSVFEYR